MTIAQILASRSLPADLGVRRALARRGAAFVCFLLAGGALVSCSTWDHDVVAHPRLSPYTSANPVVWGVAPLRNESGSSIVDELALTDKLVNEIQQFEGLNALATNRSIAAMNALNLRSIDTPDQASRLAQAMDVDAILVGTITAYDPYDPPVLGISLALYGAAPPAGLGGLTSPDWDPLALRSQPTDYPIVHSVAAPGMPLSTISDVIDAADGAVRSRIRYYAKGRHDPDAPLGWERFIKSMDLFVKFACFDLTQRLLVNEQARLSQVEATSRTAAVP